MPAETASPLPVRPVIKGFFEPRTGSVHGSRWGRRICSLPTGAGRGSGAEAGHPPASPEVPRVQYAGCRGAYLHGWM